MGRKTIVEKTRVYVECTDAYRKVKGKIIDKNDMLLKVELPTGFIMELTKKNSKGTYKFQAGLLEFISDGKPVV